MTLPDYFRILEVHPDASTEVIEKAHKALSMKYHPDRQPAEKRAWATHKMQEINEAYRVLNDAKKRQAYVRFRKKAALAVFMDEGLLGMFRRFWGNM